MMTKVHITTLGCPKNAVDSRHLEQALAERGIFTVEEVSEADVLLVNTCGFIRAAKEESIEEILKLAKMRTIAMLKEQGTRAREQRLVVFGCLVKRYREEIETEIPEIDKLFGVGEDERIAEYCKGLQPQGSHSNASARIPRASATGLQRQPRSYAYLKIAEGCDKRCTFCVIPSIRGKFKSIGPEALLREAEQQVKAGARELVVVAQDITSYGKELGGPSLVSLLKDLSALPGEFWIRLLYLYPTSVNDELLDLIAGEEKIVKYLDIPLQHSEDRLLRLMGRRGTRKEYLRLMGRLRHKCPGVTLRTTFIVGFPTETEDEFHGLMDFVEEVRFERLGAFMYSREEGTTSGLLKGQIPLKVKKRRYDALMKAQALISFEGNRALIGRRLKAIIDEVDGPVILARLFCQAPEIDGLTIIQEPPGKSQRFGQKIRPGDVVTVEVTDAYDYDLKAFIVEDGP